jgi:tocopherol O-methyltransferase
LSEQNKADYYSKIESYYKQSLNAYKDAWAMDSTMAIHYGYWDAEVKSFKASLGRMNQIMATFANIQAGEKVLDAGCGVGGSSIFLALNYNCHCTGITLSPSQLEIAKVNSVKNNVAHLTKFEIMDYTQTNFANQSFDIVWGCESICYAYNKEVLLKEVYRILKPGGRFIMADGMVSHFDNNQNPTIKKWLQGWQVNYLETPEHWEQFGHNIGFKKIEYKNITAFTKHSSRRLLWFSLVGVPYIWWNKLFGKIKWTEIQKNNIYACWHQYWGMKKGLWHYAMFNMVK